MKYSKQFHKQYLEGPLQQKEKLEGTIKKIKELL